MAGGGLEGSADGKAAGEGAAVPHEGLLGRGRLCYGSSSGPLQWVHSDWEMLLW